MSQNKQVPNVTVIFQDATPVYQPTCLEVAVTTIGAIVFLVFILSRWL